MLKYFCSTMRVARQAILVASLAGTFFLLGGCGLAQYAALSMAEDDIIPDTGSREDILRAATADPDMALISPAFYKMASPEDVASLLRKVDPTQITQNVLTDRVRQERSGFSNLGSSLAKGILLPVFKLEARPCDPVPVALKYSKYPEVITLLAEAGCSMKGRMAVYLLARPPESRPLPVNPEVLAILLHYEPSPDNASFLLTRLLFENEEIFPVEAVRVFLTRAKNLDMRDDRGFAAMAVKSGSLEKLTLLLAAGVDPNYIFLGTQSPLSLARKLGREDMVKALLAAGAREE
jgi:hypothetical protein